MSINSAAPIDKTICKVFISTSYTPNINVGIKRKASESPTSIKSFSPVFCVESVESIFVFIFK